MRMPNIAAVQSRMSSTDLFKRIRDAKLKAQYGGRDITHMEVSQLDLEVFCEQVGVDPEDWEGFKDMQVYGVHVVLWDGA